MAPTQTYINAVERGTRLLVMMDDSSTPQSKLTSVTSLTEDGWRTKYQALHCDDGCIDSIFGDKTLGLALDEDSNDTVKSNYVKDRTGLTYYKHTTNVSGGTLFAMTLRSPDASLKGGQLLFEELPALRHWSDVAFLQWQYICERHESAPKCLKRVVQCGVYNWVTQDVISEVLGDELGKYPGHSYARTDGNNGFEALLGMPNAAGTGLLLAQHKEQLAGRSVKSIQVFQEGEESCLVLNIG